MTTTPHEYNVNYPAKNRVSTGLGSVEIEVVHASGTKKFDPNSAIIAAHAGAAGLKLGEPCAPSFLSGQPGYLYRNDQLEVALTGDELVRLFMSNLRPDEFFKLANQFGVFYEISGQFYDDESGGATSPRYTFAEQEAHTQQSKHPQLLVVKDLDGNWRPHTLMNFSTTEDIRLDFLTQDGVVARVVCMDEPKNAWIPDPFDNVVALYIGPNDELRAYGRFKNTDEATHYRPAAGGVGPNPKIIIASVNATYVQ